MMSLSPDLPQNISQFLSVVGDFNLGGFVLKFVVVQGFVFLRGNKTLTNMNAKVILFKDTFHGTCKVNKLAASNGLILFHDRKLKNFRSCGHLLSFLLEIK